VGGRAGGGVDGVFNAAPTIAPGQAFATSSRHFSAASVRNTTSITESPPSTSALVIWIARSGLSAWTSGTTGALDNRLEISSLIGEPLWFCKFRRVRPTVCKKTLRRKRAQDTTVAVVPNLSPGIIARKYCERKFPRPYWRYYFREILTPQPGPDEIP
jgi:hypothetical protein